MARLCNCPPWEIDQAPAIAVKPYEELLDAIDQANGDIASENKRRIKQNDSSLLRRITLAD